MRLWADWAPMVSDITRGGEKCNTYAACADLIAAGIQGNTGSVEKSDIIEVFVYLDIAGAK